MGEIKKNQKVKLSFKLFNGDEKELTCKVKSFDKDRITLDIATLINEYLNYLQVGDEVKAKIFTPQGINIFDAMIINSPLEQDFIIEYVENSTQIQRRDYVRVPSITKIVIERKNREVIITDTIDISGGGTKFSYDGEFNPDEEVKFTLYFPNTRLIQGKGLVLPSNYLPIGQYAMVFNEINENDRDKIVRKCFEV